MPLESQDLNVGSVTQNLSFLPGGAVRHCARLQTEIQNVL